MSAVMVPQDAPAPSETAAIIQVIERAAMNPAVDIDKMERLLQMQERVMNRNAELSFNVALNAAQSELGRVAADASNPQTKSRYASYPALDRACRPVYSQHGFALSFDTGEAPGPDLLRVVCYVSHRDGHTRTYHADMPADGKGAKGGDVMTKTHATGAAMSYGQRYLLKLIFNIAVGEDTDGNAPAGSMERITDDQLADIQALMEEVGADRQKFLNWLRVESLSLIPRRRFDAAMSALQAKRRAT